MRILHVVNSFYPSVGGLESAVRLQCGELIRLGHICDVVTLDRQPNGKKLGKEGKLGKIRIHRIPFAGLKYYKIATGALGFVKDYDIVHVDGTGFFSDFLILTKFFHKKPVVVSTYGGVFHTKNIMALKKIYFYLMQRIILKFADRVIAISRNDYRLFRKITGKNLVLAELGADIGRLLKLKGRKEKNLFIFAGRLSKNKMAENLLRAFAIVARKEPTARLCIIGEDWEGLKAGLEKLAEKLRIGKNVVFTGKLDDEGLRKYYSKADFFVSASRFESFGITAIEAMAAGCIPILNNIESFRNFVRDGESGFLVDFEDYGRTAEKIAAIMGLERGKVRKKAVESARKFGQGTRAAELVKVYEAVT
ncbi:MAG TPA: glycosyltransferase family 4 protein [archaeon]|nr:glycosyltransferase family 4 protein [archaeon]